MTFALFAGLALWTDSVLSCDGRHSADPLGLGTTPFVVFLSTGLGVVGHKRVFDVSETEREVLDMETRVCRQQLTNATLGTVDILQHW